MPESEVETEVSAIILFCPVCCTKVDAEYLGTKSVVDEQCGSCETFFSVTADPAIIAVHSMYGA